MEIEQIKDLINTSNYSQLQKNLAIRFIDRAKEKQDRNSEDIILIEKVANENKISDVILSTDEVKIYTINGNDNRGIKYPYRIIYITEKGAWRNCSTVSPTFEVAYLVYLEHKHMGLNSQFSQFAIKMLDIKLN